MATVQLDFFANDDINGDVLWSLTDDEDYFLGFEMRIALNERGAAEVRLSRHVGFAIFGSGFIDTENFVRVLVPAISATEYVFGFFLDNRNEKIMSGEEQAGEILTFGGPGPRFYLTRAQLWDEQFSGSGANLDLANRVFRWNESATVGRVLHRLKREDDENTLAQFLPDLTLGFDNDDDSAGDPWSDPIVDNDEFELPIGVDYEQLLTEVEKAGDVETTFHLGDTTTPVLRMDVWQAYGETRTGSSFGAGVVRFRESHDDEDGNILTDLERDGNALRKATHALVFGKNIATAQVTKPSYDAGEYAKAIAYDYPRSTKDAVLQRAGLRMLRRQDAEEKELEFEIMPGFDPDVGLYFYGDPDTTNGHFKVGDYGSLKTGGNASWGQFDFNNTTERIMACRLSLDTAAVDTDATTQALSWHIIVELNVDRDSSSSPSHSTGAATDGNDGSGHGGGCPCLKLCASTRAPTTATVDQFLNANDPGGTAENWAGLLGNQGGSGDGANGTDWYYFKSGGSPAVYQTSHACTPGQTITVSGWWGCRGNAHLKIGFGTAAAGTSGGSFIGTVTDEFDLHPDAPDHSHANEWTFFSETVVVPVGAVSYALGHTATSGGGVDFDEITVEVGEGDAGAHPLHGTDGEAAHCDHIHHVLSVDEPTVDDDEDVGYPVGTVWLQVDDVDAPTEIVAWWYSLDDTAGAAVWAVPPGGGGGGGGHDITEDGGSPFTTRGNLDFRHGLDVTDDSGSDSTRVAVDESELTHNSLGGLTTGDPHTQYALDTDLSTHAGAADPHTGYVLESIFAAKGDLLGASANDTPSLIAAGSEGQIPVQRSAATPGVAFETQHSALVMVIGNGVAVISTGVKGYVRVPFACEIVRESILADQSGAIKIDVWKDTYANFPPTDADTITGGNEPEIAASGTKDEDTTLTSWTKTLAEGDVLGINVDSCTSIKQVTFELKVKRT